MEKRANNSHHRQDPMEDLHCRIPASLARAIRERVETTGESLAHLVRSALYRHLQLPFNTLYQVSSINALVKGLYQGEVTIAELKKHGDFGIGTFDHLNGEMVVVDGEFYQVRADGQIVIAGEKDRTPYAMISWFRPTTSLKLADCNSLADLESALDSLRDSPNLFYAIRIDGVFNSILTRSVRPMEYGTPLVEAAGKQQLFKGDHVSGTIVGYWSPGYLQNILVSGYHLHFLSADRTLGGHLLDCSGREMQVQIEKQADFQLSLPETPSFLHADLTGNPAADVQKAEKQQKQE